MRHADIHRSMLYRLELRLARGTHTWRPVRDERGTAMVEMGLVLPVFLLVLVGVMEFGLLINAFVTVQHAAREGVRLGITGATDSEITDRVRAAAVPLSPALVNVSVAPAPWSRERGQPLTVTVQYTHTFLTPLISAIVGNSVTLQSALDMRME
ncbi:MAG: pilus assembly protein [Firmicutes bacterium]|nr:pilus assembly protein [Bacillota bacterium]